MIKKLTYEGNREPGGWNVNDLAEKINEIIDVMNEWENIRKDIDILVQQPFGRFKPDFESSDEDEV